MKPERAERQDRFRHNTARDVLRMARDVRKRVSPRLGASAARRGLAAWYQ
jgi:hypothetical protein